MPSMAALNAASCLGSAARRPIEEVHIEEVHIEEGPIEEGPEEG